MFPHCSLWFNFADFAVLFSLFAFHIISSQLLSVYWYSTSLIKFWPSLCNNAIHSLLENTLAVSLSSSSRVFLGAICYNPHSLVIYDLNQDHICTFIICMPCHATRTLTNWGFFSSSDDNQRHQSSELWKDSRLKLTWHGLFSLQNSTSQNLCSAKSGEKSWIKSTECTYLCK